MTRGSGHTLKHGKFHLNIVSVVKHWSRQRGSGVSTLANIQILTGEDLEQPAPAHSEQGVGLNDLQRSPPTSASWWYVGSEQAPCFKNHLLTSLMIVFAVTWQPYDTGWCYVRPHIGGKLRHSAAEVLLWHQWQTSRLPIFPDPPPLQMPLDKS